MPFVVAGGGRLEDRIDEAAPRRAVRRIADAAGDRLHENITRLTPVDLTGHDSARPHLRDTITRSHVREYPTPFGQAAAVSVQTDDPIAPHVEYNTKPHDIPNAFGFGDHVGIGGPFAGRFHPGTTGQHFFSRGTAETEAQLREIADEPLRRMERELFRRR